MEMTQVERMLGKSAGKIIEFVPDWIMINDGDGHNAITCIDPSKRIPVAERVIIVLDHDIPAGSFDSAANQKKLIEFSEKQGIHRRMHGRADRKSAHCRRYPG